MENNTNSLKSILDSLISRLDEQKIASDKQLEAQIAFNTQVSQELRIITKQLDLTQADVDDARKSLERSPSPQESATVIHPQPPPPLRPPAAQHQLGMPPSPRLGAGPPLLQQLGATAATPTAQLHQPQQFNHGDYFVKLPKHDFPRFDGSAPYLWLDRCRAYFDLHKVPPHSWVTTAMLYIDGQAAHWLQAFRQTHHGLTWDAFCAAITEEFGSDEFEMEMHKLLQLRQQGTVAEYRQLFDTHIYHLLALDPTLSNKFFITQFLLGLKDELRAAVSLQAPSRSLVHQSWRAFKKRNWPRLERMHGQHQQAGRRLLKSKCKHVPQPRRDHRETTSHASDSSGSSGGPTICASGVVTATPGSTAATSKHNSSQSKWATTASCCPKTPSTP